MKNKSLYKRGFTLIELLVVVLIIGVLVSVALPQYERAVQKARLSEVATTFSAISKGVDAWFLENDGYPSDSFATFFGNDAAGNKIPEMLDISLPCDNVGYHKCYTKIGSWYAGCTPLSHSSPNCSISLDTGVNADTTTGNQWLDEAVLKWERQGTNPAWKLTEVRLSGTRLAEVCRWWKDMYGTKGFGRNPSIVLGDAATKCAAYL